MVVLILMSGCGLRPQVAAPGSDEAAPFRPATQLPPVTATVPLPTQAVNATIVPNCNDNLRFITDRTIPDGTVVAPNSSLDKQWEVENTGTCNWDERYHLRLVGGPDMSAQTIQALFPARAGSRAVLRIQMTAPAKSGSYQGAWRAYNASDKAFGDVVYIDIVVK